MSRSTTKNRSRADSTPAPSSAEPEVVLRLRGITKRFATLLANDAVSFDLARGEIIALLGENGAGKTTLMNILFGHYVADEGTIEAFGQPLPPGEPKAALAAGIGMVHQHFTLADNLSVADNILLGTESLWRLRSSRAEALARIRQLSESFGLAVDPQANVSALSVGERQRVEILKALYRHARVLILDEPTAVLTPQEAKALFATLQSLVAQGLSVIFISHKLYEVMEVSRRILVLRSGKLVAERDAAKTNQAELADLMVGRPVAEPTRQPQDPGRVIAELSGVSVMREGKLLLDGTDMQLRSGEILGLAGVSGNGQSTLAGVFAGLYPPSAGTMILDGRPVARLTPRDAVRRGIARIPEDRHSQGLIADMSVTENVIAECYSEPPFSHHGLLDWNAARGLANTIIRDYEVRCPSPQTPVRLLSGGNMQKLLLGRVLFGNPRLIIANQPTRGLDIGAVAYVHGQLLAARSAGAAILLISEDLDEIMLLADRIAVAYRGRVSEPLTRKAADIRAIGLMMSGHGFGLAEPEPGHAA